MKISFVIPAFNEEFYIEKCIDSIRKSVNIPEFDYEIIVVCNNCTDKTVFIAASLGAIVILSDADNIAKVRNAGANKSCGDFIIFVDADSEINWELFNSIDFNTVGGGALVQLNNITKIGSWCEEKWNTYCLKNKVFTGSFIFVDRSVFYLIGGFPEDYYLLEDVIFSETLNQYAGSFQLRTQLITNHGVLTSDRKLKLYSWWEHLSFWIRFWWNRERVISNRKECWLWYNDRREIL